jgi:GntR family transcriptional regulator
MSPALPLPKYHQIYLVLREQIGEGRFAGGLPGEVALAAQFGVARITVRKALEQLAAEGLIDRARGRGTVSMGLRTKVRVLSCELLPATEAVASALQLAPGTAVQKAVRVRSTKEGPLSLITTHVPAALAQGFGKRELAKQPILILLEQSGVRIGRAVQTISARLADAMVAKELGVSVGSALLAVTRLIFDEDDRPVQWLHGLYRPDRYQYEMQLSRVGGIDAKVWVSTELTAQFH